ncbi:competence/damage-inducible protein A [Eubacteriaceae bacterium ES3]|nr:competence/damage-inducible protein A [Eubacteriaceae bacterium ES3]
MRCELISVGTELLVGDTLNTNVQFLSRELSLLGIRVYYHTTVGDNPERLKEAVKIAFDRSDLIITTGGLGPTQDDLTKEIIAELFGRQLIEDKQVKQDILSYFANREYPMTSNNFKQALIPEGATALHNDWGTAPGIYINQDDRQVFMLPGPPREMVHLFQSAVLPILDKNEKQLVISRYYNLSDIGESAAEDRLLDLIDKQKNPTIATYAKMGEVQVRITANGSNETEINALLDQYEALMFERFGNHIYSLTKESLNEAVCRMLLEKKITVATAESCSGGLIASQLTRYPGISEVFGMGLVTYSNEAKIKLLDVSPDTLEKYGAVSEETAREMCMGLRYTSGADCCIAVTGVAGPGGGTEEKPAGLVYIGVFYKNNLEVTRWHFKGERQVVQDKTAIKAFNLIRKAID